MENNCPICFESCSPSAISIKGDSSRINCPRCGRYEASGTFVAMAENPEGKLGPQGGRTRSALSAWTRERTDRGITTELSSAFLSSKDIDLLGSIFWSLTPLSFHEKADRLLLALEKETEYAGHEVPFADNFSAWIARAGAINEREAGRIFEYLQQEEQITKSVEFSLDNEVELISPIMILPNGWEHLGELRKQHPDSQQGFIAMWFNEDLRPLNIALHGAIEAAGYSPLRIDKKDHVNRIDDQIQVEIKSSRFVVADLTGQNQGVYFEAGYALGLGLPVIWTCRKDEIDDKKVHFDIRQYNFLPWEPDKLEDFKDRLRWRIVNIYGKGRGVPPAGQ